MLHATIRDTFPLKFDDSKFDRSMDFIQSTFAYREPRRLGVMLDKKLWLVEDDHRRGETLKVQLGTYEFSED